MEVREVVCKICGSEKNHMIYEGKIRDGKVGQYTKSDVAVYQCEDCHVIWHEDVLSDIRQYYESSEYRDSLEGGSEEERFYRLHDRETMEKLQYTGTEIFRKKAVADIGCGCGAFLDFISGVADIVIAVEPSEAYREIMDRKHFHTYPYTDQAILDFGEKIDVVTSFDVIEHVEDPECFLNNIFRLLKQDGRAIIGTPTDAPVMRYLLGKIYEEKLLFSTQHLWIFSEESLKTIARRCSYSRIQVKYFQRYGIDNAMGWLREKAPNSGIEIHSVTNIMNSVWKSQLAEKGLGDYIVLYLQK